MRQHIGSGPFRIVAGDPSHANLCLWPRPTLRTPKDRYSARPSRPAPAGALDGQPAKPTRRQRPRPPR